MDPAEARQSSAVLRRLKRNSHRLGWHMIMLSSIFSIFIMIGPVAHHTTAITTAAPMVNWPINYQNYEYCHTSNFVRDRGDSYSSRITQEYQPYSILPQTFQALSSHATICDSVYDTMHAISAGRRHWINVTHQALSSMERERVPSYFIPAHCNLPPLTAWQLCDFMNQYSHIITIGDSLTRHLRAAFFMALLDNLIDGGMVQPDGHVNPDEFYGCRCDG